MAAASNTTFGTRRAVLAPSRRQFGGASLAALCGAVFAGAVVLPDPGEAFPAEGIRISGTPLQPSPDARLLALCAEAMRLDRAAEALHGAEEHATLRQWFVVAERIAATPALTPAGMQAKARIVLHLMEPSSRRPDTDDTKWDEAGIYGPLMWSLVNDLAAVA
jgi:hypothetical protein